jgi:hypothetical protein
MIRTRLAASAASDAANPVSVASGNLRDSLRRRTAAGKHWGCLTYRNRAT